MEKQFHNTFAHLNNNNKAQPSPQIPRFFFDVVVFSINMLLLWLTFLPCLFLNVLLGSTVKVPLLVVIDFFF